MCSHLGESARASDAHITSHPHFLCGTLIPYWSLRAQGSAAKHASAQPDHLHMPGKVYCSIGHPSSQHTHLTGGAHKRSVSLPIGRRSKSLHPDPDC